jgi:DeoR family glycerol-3-phosphate regulon repressor
MGAKASDRKFTSLIGICIKGLCIQFVMRADKKLNGTALIVKKRQQDIVDFVQRSQEVSVEVLSEHFHVSSQTIRTYLRELDLAGKIVRTHGGARAVDGKTNLEYDQRKQMAALEKVAIGHAAAKLIPNNSSLFINIGTTTEAFSDALIHHSGLLVITNNINVAGKLGLSKANEVVVAGGTVRASDGGIVGEVTVDFIKQFMVDFAVIGASAIDEEGALLDFDYREVKVAKAIIENARHVILVSDATKLGRKAHVRIGHISQVNTFVTDHILSEDLRAICTASDVEIIETLSNT